MLEKKENKIHLYKGWKCPMANALSQYFLPQSETGSLQRETWVKVPLSRGIVGCRSEGHIETTRFLFLQLYQNFTATMIVINTWKNDFTQTGVRKVGVTSGPGHLPVW